MDHIKLEEHRMGNLTLWAREGHEKPRSLNAIEKISNERLDAVISEKAEQRATSCWIDGCTHAPHHWVREVHYDMKNDKAEADFRQVTTADYVGPIPGFCIGHIGSGPPLLAQAVYFTRPEMQWGFKPKRWFVIFTDGTKQGGDCISLDPHQIQPDFIEEFQTEESRYAA